MSNNTLVKFAISVCIMLMLWPAYWVSKWFGLPKMVEYLMWGICLLLALFVIWRPDRTRDSQEVQQHNETYMR